MFYSFTRIASTISPSQKKKGIKKVIETVFNMAALTQGRIITSAYIINQRVCIDRHQLEHLLQLVEGLAPYFSCNIDEIETVTPLKEEAIEVISFSSYSEFMGVYKSLNIEDGSRLFRQDSVRFILNNCDKLPCSLEELSFVAFNIHNGKDKNIQSISTVHYENNTLTEKAFSIEEDQSNAEEVFHAFKTVLKSADFVVGRNLVGLITDLLKRGFSVEFLSSIKWIDVSEVINGYFKSSQLSQLTSHKKNPIKLEAACVLFDIESIYNSSKSYAEKIWHLFKAICDRYHLALKYYPQVKVITLPRKKNGLF